MDLKAHKNILKGLYDRSKFLAITILIFGSMSLAMNFKIIDPTLSFIIMIADVAIIGLLYGWMVTKSTNSAKTINDYMEESKKTISDKANEELRLGATAKNTFWLLAFMLPVAGAINIYFPSISRVGSHFMFDFAFYVSMAYGLQASYFLDSFATDVGLDLLDNALKKEEIK